MEKLTIIFQIVIPSIIFCSIILIILAFNSRADDNYQFNNKSVTEREQSYPADDSGDKGELPIKLKDVKNLSLPVCYVSKSADYVAHNDLLALYNVQFRYTKIVFDIQFVCLEKNLEDVKLNFMIGSRSYTMELPYGFSSASYRIILPRYSNKFVLKSVEWNASKHELGEQRYFKFPIWIKGKNILRYCRIADIVVMDDMNVILGFYRLRLFGNVLVPTGTKYYAEVK